MVKHSIESGLTVAGILIILLRILMLLVPAGGLWWVGVVLDALERRVCHDGGGIIIIGQRCVMACMVVMHGRRRGWSRSSVRAAD